MTMMVGAVNILCFTTLIIDFSPQIYEVTICHCFTALLIAYCFLCLQEYNLLSYSLVLYSSIFLYFLFQNPNLLLSADTTEHQAKIISLKKIWWSYSSSFKSVLFHSVNADLRWWRENKLLAWQIIFILLNIFILLSFPLKTIFFYLLSQFPSCSEKRYYILSFAKTYVGTTPS